VARALPTLLVLALLGATAAAFALTERLKLEKTPIYRTHVGRPIPGQPNRTGLALFSPVCDCKTDHVEIRFFLRKADRLRVTIERGGETVDTLVDDKPYPRGWVRLSWNGIQPTGIVVDDGDDYMPVVHLAHEHRTIVLPNPITVDTTPPKIETATSKPPILSPDGDGRGDRLTVTYTSNEKSSAVLRVGPRVAVRAKFARTHDTLHWSGRNRGRVMPKGSYPVRLVARDQAGNATKPTTIGHLTVRYVSLGRSIVSVAPNGRFYMRVSADAPVHWRLAGRTGTARPGTIVLRAPKKVGTYRLYVTLGTHAASARVRVERIG
jgi:hypothetical protein